MVPERFERPTLRFVDSYINVFLAMHLVLFRCMLNYSDGLETIPGQRTK